MDRIKQDTWPSAIDNPSTTRYNFPHSNFRLTYNRYEPLSLGLSNAESRYFRLHNQ